MKTADLKIPLLPVPSRCEFACLDNSIVTSTRFLLMFILGYVLTKMVHTIGSQIFIFL